MTKNQNQTDTTADTTVDAPEATVDTPESTEATPTPPKPTPPAEPTPEAEDKKGSSAPFVEPDDDKADKVGNEAAKYRRQLRTVEAERDTLTGTVGSLRKQLIDQNLPHGSSINSEALWATGRTPEEFFTDTGAIDTAKLTTAIQDTHKTLGIHFGPDPITDSGTGTRGGTTEPSWADALKNR